MDIEELYVIGEEYYVKKEYKKALEHFEKYYSSNESYDCLNYIGCCYLGMEDFDSAVNIFKRLINECPKVERPVFNLGRVYLKQGRLQDALDCFNNAININPNSEDAYYYLGVYYDKINDFDEARIYYEKSLSLNFEQSETHLNLGICFYRLQLYNEALKEFDLALKYDDECIQARECKWIIYIEIKDYSKALRELLYVNTINPYDTYNLIDIIHCYYKLDDFRNAQEWVSKLLSVEPDNEFACKTIERINLKLSKIMENI
ncbi:tetratricopeptide repeat protein [Clostridium sp. 'White wine YQ']|uniref:tetratricopeptide repeat protein n=1 Tax=Clostridium sp. 'White wine YQ' TaxID=3027474 RepID=UPI0023673EAD|nr:tetratricopeptide repeat protein [Clostridium sp. 'White wine YQ']MDD7793060.1 tetratricopeptide repeat protein [Clostridium sp. 'White wine YQ']